MWRFHRLERICSICNRRNYVAVKCYECGRIEYSDSPDTLQCYGCQLRSLAEPVRAQRKAKFRALWRMATGEPVPAELL